MTNAATSLLTLQLGWFIKNLLNTTKINQINKKIPRPIIQLQVSLPVWNYHKSCKLMSWHERAVL